VFLPELISALGNALSTAFDMFWLVLWPLVLGFGLSAIVQEFVSHQNDPRNNVAAPARAVQWEGLQRLEVCGSVERG
jgi:hypothetical protein